EMCLRNRFRTTQGGRKAALLACGPTRAVDAQHVRKAIRRGQIFLTRLIGLCLLLQIAAEW
ncbi:hypothetical protein DXO170_20770, partial [Xanthomonas oryzae pv. oryzae]